MLDQQDLKWIAQTVTELNTSLQQIARQADLARQHHGEQSYLESLSEKVELASRSAQALFDRVTSKILEGSQKKRPPTASTEEAAAREKGSSDTTASAALLTEISVKNPGGTREFILLVDDEPEIAELASEMLAEEGYKVIVAREGFEALKIFQQMNRQIGLVILDYFLPVMDGDAVFEELRALDPNANVVLSSGFAEQNKIGAMLAQGLRGFIPKPYTREKLLAHVRSAIEAGRRLSRQSR